MDTYIFVFTQIIKQRGMSEEEGKEFLGKTLANGPGGILSYYLMYLKYENKQEIVDHVRLHKMHVYDVKFPYDAKRKELIWDMNPQILTSQNVFDDETNYFGEEYLDFLPPGEILANEKELNLYFFKCVKERYPQHYVSYQLFSLKIFF